MKDSTSIESRLFNRVRGERCPLEALLSTGVLAREWAQRCWELLAEAKQRRQHESCWPRELVAAVHLVSIELDSRYRAWCSFERGPRNETTERLLAAVRIASEFFLLSPITEAGHGGQDTTGV
jgi:hypothetical protein